MLGCVRNGFRIFRHIHPATICCFVILSLLLILHNSPVPSHYFFDPSQLNGTALAQYNRSIDSQYNKSIPLVRLVDQDGHPTTNRSIARGFLIKDIIGLIPNTTSNHWHLVGWDTFVPNWTTWVLPWLIATSMIPFDAQDYYSCLMEFCWTLGSPAHASYHLTIWLLVVRQARRNYNTREHSVGEAGMDAANRNSLTTQSSDHSHELNEFYASNTLHNGIYAMPRVESPRQPEKMTAERTIYVLPIVSSILTIIQFFLSGADDSTILVGLALNSLFCWLLPVSWGLNLVRAQAKASTICDLHTTRKLSSVAVATIAAIFVQWGTTGSAIFMAYMTPVRGLGCTSGPYLIYGSAASLILFLHLLANRLHNHFHFRTVLNLVAGSLAIINTLWLLTFTTIQFTNVPDNFWCMCSALGNGFGESSWVPLLMLPQQFYEMSKTFWAIGTFVAVGDAAVLWALLYLGSR